MMKTLFHACGRKILLEYQWTGQIQQPCYRDSDTLQDILSCPECGELLSEEVLHDEAAEIAMRKLFGEEF